MYVAQQIKHNDENDDKPKAASTPFPARITRDQRSPEIIHLINFCLGQKYYAN